MIHVNPTSLGFTLLFLGFSFFIFTRLLLRAKQQPISLDSAAYPQPNGTQLEPHSNGFILVQSGGRILHSNLDKLEWCKFSADEIDLNHLLYRFRPSEVFLNLCTIEGRAQLSIDNMTIEAISVKVPYGNSQVLLVLIKRI